MTVAERRSDIKLTTESSKDIGENWPRYNGTALYLIMALQYSIHQDCGAYNSPPPEDMWSMLSLLVTYKLYHGQF